MPDHPPFNPARHEQLLRNAAQKKRDAETALVQAILAAHFDGLSDRAIAAQVGTTHPTIAKLIRAPHTT